MKLEFITVDNISNKLPPSDHEWTLHTDCLLAQVVVSVPSEF